MNTVRLFTILSVLIPGIAVADEKSNDRDPWNGFGIGSWVIRSETTTRGDKTETTREKHTRIAAKDPKSIEREQVKEGKTPGTFDGEKSTAWHIPGLDPATNPKFTALETRKAELEIEGKKYACEVKPYEIAEEGIQATVTYWHCKDLSIPYREMPSELRSLAMRPDVLRLEVDFRGKNHSVKEHLQVVNLNEERKIGDKKIACVRQEGGGEFVEGEMKVKGKVTIWLSNDVPGRQVETLVESEIAGTKMRSLERIEAFDVVKGK